jgi:hypothetical protein
VLKALERVGNQLRGRLGESLVSVEKFNRPLEQATTSSLEALQSYTQWTAFLAGISHKEIEKGCRFWHNSFVEK